MAIKTYTFPAQRIDAEGNTLQLILAITIPGLHSSSLTVNPKLHQLGIKSWGNFNIEYDLEDALLTPSTYSIVLFDNSQATGANNNSIEELLFTENDSIQAGGTIELKRNGVTIFSGSIIEDSIEFNEASRELSISAAPNTDTINKRMVFDINGTTPLNPFGYNTNTFYMLKQYLSDIYSLPGVNIQYELGNLEIIHDWKFKGRRITGVTWRNNFNLIHIAQVSSTLYFENTFGISNCGDILKKLALDWGCFTGLLRNDYAFFKKLFYYESGNLQTLVIKNKWKGYRYHLIDYVRVTAELTDPNQPYEAGVFTQLENRFLERRLLSGFFYNSTGSNGTNVHAYHDGGYFNFFVDGNDITDYPQEDTSYYSNNGSTFKCVGVLQSSDTGARIQFERTSGTNNPTSSGTLTRVSGGGDITIDFSQWDSGSGWYFVYLVKDESFVTPVYTHHGQVVADYWMKHRGTNKHCRVDKFLCKGTGYDYLKNFNDGNSRYQPIKFDVNFETNETTIEAIYLGENITEGI